MSQQPSQSTYTAHASSAAAAAGAIVAIAAWALSQFAKVTVPGEIVVAAIVVVTPIVSVVWKRLGFFSD